MLKQTLITNTAIAKKRVKPIDVLCKKILLILVGTPHNDYD